MENIMYLNLFFVMANSFFAGVGAKSKNWLMFWLNLLPALLNFYAVTLSLN